MKNLILIFTSLLSFSSCIKIEDENIDCANKPITPVLSAASYVYSLGDTLKVTVANPQLGSSYTLYTPTGEKYYSYPFQLFLNSGALAGEFELEASTTQSICKSDKVKFNVTVNGVFPSCGMAGNTFKLGGSNTLSTSIANGTVFTEYYQITWTFGGTNLYMYFGLKPSTTATQVYRVYNASYPEYLEDDQCKVSFSAGSSYTGTTGTVFTKFENGVYQIVFCNVNMRRSSGVNYPNSQANLYSQE